jgi:hypothetical protein
MDAAVPLRALLLGTGKADEPGVYERKPDRRLAPASRRAAQSRTAPQAGRTDLAGGGPAGAEVRSPGSTERGGLARYGDRQADEF